LAQGLLKLVRAAYAVDASMDRRFRISALVVIVALVPACRSKEAVGTAPARTGSAPAPDLRVVPDAAVRQALNPGDEKPYSGPVGHVSGTVRASGDPAPSDPAVLAKIPQRCSDARAFYGKRFREGPHRELGDVLVAVTGYAGYLPPKDSFKTVVIRGCAFESRTIALTFGQSLHVLNKGGETFMPDLRGAQSAAFMVAVPGGDAVKLFPDHVGQYELVDRSQGFARADVFVLKYPTTAVTGLDGKFTISAIPAGEVMVSALLPATGQTTQKRVTIVAGETSNVDFELPWTAESAAAPSASSR
jgi:hypothetical protein